MNWMRRIVNVFRPERLSRDIAREMEFHVAERADDLVAAGATQDAAVREARRRLGHATTQRELTRDADVARVLDSIVADVRYAVRALRRTPGYTAIAILSLALGIGANTAIFSVVNAVMLRSLPVRDPQQLVQVRMEGDGEFTNPIWEQLRARQATIGAMTAFSQHGFSVTSGGDSRTLDGSWVSGDYFSVLGVGAIVGRPLAASDDWRGCPGVAMLSYGYWQSAFGGREDILGRSITLDSRPFQIIGVVEPGFDGAQVGFASHVFVPICAEAISRGAGSALDRRSTWWLNIMGRPLPGSSAAQMDRRLAAVSSQVLDATVPADWTSEQQKEYLGRQLGAVPAPTGLSELRQEYGHALYVLLGAVGLVLLIACANVANLLLARAAVREHELAIRSAIGAGRSRLIRQLLTESVVLALAGATVGVGLARVTTSALLGAVSQLGTHVALDVRMDARVLGFTLGVALLTGLIFGVAPAWRSALVAPRASLAVSPRQTAGGSARLTPSKLLVTAQVALLLPLLVGAGLMLATLRNLTTMDPGFHADGVVLMHVDAQHDSRLTPKQRARAYEDLLARLRSLPGIASASASDVTPVGHTFWNDAVSVSGYAPVDKAGAIADFNEVSPNYFGTLRTPILIGRDFNRSDAVGAPPVAIVSQAMMRQFFRGANPIGRTFRVGFGSRMGPPVEVIGVVKDAKYSSMRQSPPPTAYIPLAQDTAADRSFDFEIRAAGGVNAVRPGALAAAHDVDASFTVSFSTLSDQISESLGLERLLAQLSTIFGALALGLAMIGLYGVMSYSVVRRRGEIGIRMALGASASGVRRLLLRDVARVVFVGLVIGLAIALVATRTLKTVVYGLAPNDPLVIALAAAALAGVAGVAGYLPARRASRGDPMLALRRD